MLITTLPYKTYNELADGFRAKVKRRKIWRDDIKETLQQHGLTINDAPRQARAKILKTPRHLKAGSIKYPPYEMNKIFIKI
jgi:hypothetical protein